jgi:multidrug efflux pump
VRCSPSSPSPWSAPSPSRPPESLRSWERGLVAFIDRRFNAIHRRYERWLRGSLNFLPVTTVFALIILGSIYFLYNSATSELAPQEDEGVIITLATPAANSTLQQRSLYDQQTYEDFASFPETAHVFQLDMPGQDISGMVLKPWDQRTRTTAVLQPLVQQKMAGIAGAQIVAFQPPPLPGSQGLPIQFVINTTEPFNNLNTVAQTFLKDARASGLFMFVDTDLRIDDPQTVLEIDRGKAALLGLNMSDVGKALGSMLGGGYVNYFGLDGRSYKVIPQVQQRFRLNTDQLLNYHVQTSSGASVPLSTIAHPVTRTQPESLNHFQQLNDAMIQGVPAPGVALGTAVTYLQQLAVRDLPPGYTVDYAGLSRQYEQESGGFVLTFGFALIIIYLSLAALFESFRDPFIILVSVPMSIAGALFFVGLGLGGASLNIYTEVGLVTLMGLISKHGILIVEFANGLQMEGRSRREAIEMAAGIRLRPILMTTAAMVLGVVPLIVASGAGAVSRFNMGLVIATGLAIGTLFTLFVVPAVYMLIAEDHARHRTTDLQLHPRSKAEVS